jgi:hypothetical protein
MTVLCICQGTERIQGKGGATSLRAVERVRVTLEGLLA